LFCAKCVLVGLWNRIFPLNGKKIFLKNIFFEDRNFQRDLLQNFSKSKFELLRKQKNKKNKKLRSRTSIQKFLKGSGGWEKFLSIELLGFQMKLHIFCSLDI